MCLTFHMFCKSHNIRPITSYARDGHAKLKKKVKGQKRREKKDNQYMQSEIDFHLNMVLWSENINQK